MKDLGINFGFEQDQFFMTFNSCSRTPGNFRYESDLKAKEIYSQNSKVMLSLSSGLDSQIVLHSFYSQGIPLKCAFLHMPTFNDTEFERVLKLKKKYNLDLEIVELDPLSNKNYLLDEYEQTGIPPYQLLHKKFLSLLPTEYDFIQGVDGPDFFRKDNKWYIIQTANSFVNSRIRGFQLLKRAGGIISWEKSPELFLSLINDDITKSFMYAYDNIAGNGLSYQHDQEIPIIDHYDLYIKPYIYAKYWQDELEYFPKYQGPENVQWIMETKWHAYKKNLIVIDYRELVGHLTAQCGEIKKYYQRVDV